MPDFADLPEWLKRAMGANCYRCIFIHNNCDAKQVHLLALYPPSGSVPSQEYNNQTSLEIAKWFHGFNFQWNDLFPFVPTSNKAVDQAFLMQLLLSGDIANLVHDLQLRMMEFISSENDRRRRPVVIVCGSTANKAFELFIQPMPSSVLRISTFSIVPLPGSNTAIFARGTEDRMVCATLRLAPPRVTFWRGLKARRSALAIRCLVWRIRIYCRCTAINHVILKQVTL